MADTGRYHTVITILSAIVFVTMYNSYVEPTMSNTFEKIYRDRGGHSAKMTLSRRMPAEYYCIDSYVYPNLRK